MQPVAIKTSWGHPAQTHRQDPRILRKYNAFLRTFHAFGVALHYVLLAALGAVVIWFGYACNFENLVVSDGTKTSCMYDGATEGMNINGK